MPRSPSGGDLNVEFLPKTDAAVTEGAVVTENVAETQQQSQQQRCRSPSLTPENMNQINHLKGQFRFVDDAQRLFRPLLEAIGVNIKVSRILLVELESLI